MLEPMIENSKAVSFKFGKFSPSDRRILLSYFKTDDGIETFVSALVIYLEGWAEADWLEAYSVEIIGEWISKNAPKKAKTSVRKIVSQKIRSKKQNRVETYKALRLGMDLEIGSTNIELQNHV